MGDTTKTLNSKRTILIDNKVKDILKQALQKILGHKKIQTTLDTYTSVFKEFSQNELEKVKQYFEAQGL